MFNEPDQAFTLSATLLEVHDLTDLLLVELSTRPVVLKLNRVAFHILHSSTLFESYSQNDYILIWLLSKSNGKRIVPCSSSSYSHSFFPHISLSPHLCGSDLNVRWRDNGISFVLLLPPLSFFQLDLQWLTLRIKTRVWLMVRHTLRSRVGK